MTSMPLGKQSTFPRGVASNWPGLGSRAVPCLVLLLVLFCAQAATAAVLAGLVVGIADGDTITVLDDTKTQYKVRLAGIDAPEKKQPFGNRSRQNLAAMVFQKRVVVEWVKRDRYRRIVGKVLLGGKDINLAQLAAGMAWHYKQYQHEQMRSDRTIYAQTELDARAGRIGLWRDAAPIAPWEFRREMRAERFPTSARTPVLSWRKSWSITLGLSGTLPLFLYLNGELVLLDA
jgi:endonuclease YncB( thermonuclease family)